MVMRVTALDWDTFSCARVDAFTALQPAGPKIQSRNKKENRANDEKLLFWLISGENLFEADRLVLDRPELHRF